MDEAVTVLGPVSVSEIVSDFELAHGFLEKHKDFEAFAIVGVESKVFDKVRLVLKHLDSSLFVCRDLLFIDKAFLVFFIVVLGFNINLLRVFLALNFSQFLSGINELE
jgi:hypothetical protein